MADQKISQLDPVSGLDGTEKIPIVQDGGNAYTTPNAIAGWVSAAVYAGVCNGRLTLTSGTPVTTTDVTAATTIYFTPFKGNQVALYDGAAWVLRTFTERSLAVPATTSTMYDLFLYNNAGTLTLEAVAWTNDTTRATALTTQDGVLVKSGATTRRYLGSFRTTGSSGQTEDSLSKRFLWNYYNRIKRSLFVSESTDSWTYSTAAWQQVRNQAANKVEAVIGVIEDTATADAYHHYTTSIATNQPCYTGIGLNTTSANSAQIKVQGTANSGNAGYPSAHYDGYPATGYNYFAWLEYGAGSNTQTWFGDAGIPSLLQSGLRAILLG